MEDYLRILGFKEDEMEITHFCFNIVMFVVYSFIGIKVNEKIFATYFLAITCSELIELVKKYFYKDKVIDLEILLAQVVLCITAIFMAVSTCYHSFEESFFRAIGF